MANRVTQEYIEVLFTGETVAARVTQLFIEVILPIQPNIYDSINNWAEDVSWELTPAVASLLYLGEIFYLTDEVSVVNPANIVDLPLTASDDLFNLTDAIVIWLGQLLSDTDTLTLSDAFEGFSAWLLDLSDSFSLTDSIEVNGEISRTASDTLTLTDSAAAELKDPRIFQTASDQIVLSDASVVVIRLETHPDDNFVLSDEVIVRNNHRLALTETLALTDSVSTSLVTATLDLSDSLTLSEGATVIYGFALNFSDSTDNWLDSASAGVTSYTLNWPVVEDIMSMSDSAVAVLGSSLNSYIRRYLNDVI